MGHRQNWKDRTERLTRELMRMDEPAALELAAKINACGVEWSGRYRCRSPFCRRCCACNVQQQQRAALAWFDGMTNEDIAFASVVAGGINDLAGLDDGVGSMVRGLRNRFAAGRRSSPGRWDTASAMGWTEIDAISGDQVPLLGSDRRALLPQIAPIRVEDTAPTWIITHHALVGLGGVGLGEMRDAFRRQWPIEGQADVRALDVSRAVEDNLETLAAYSNKHSTTTTLGAIREPWPHAWQARIFSALGEKRNAFEFLRFSVSPTSFELSPDVPSSVLALEVDPMPFVHSFSPYSMYYNTGGPFE